MYRKHLNKMESKTGIKTMDKLSEIPVVNSAVITASDYYGKVKETNSLLRTSCNLAELSLKTFKYAATPITYLCKKPIESVDSYLSEKVDQIETNYPSITKPTEQLTANAISHAKDIYDKTVKHPIETLSTIKDKTVTSLNSISSNKTVQAAFKVGTDTFVKSADVCLENRFAKMLTDPVLDFTEKSLNYLLPPVTYAQTVINGVPLSEEEIKNPTTIKRIYNINKRIYDTTFSQLTYLHMQFERTIEKLKGLKGLFESFYLKSKTQVSNFANTVSQNTLVARCSDFIQKNDISLKNFESLCKSYYKAIMSDVNQILENYMNQVKNFPLVFNGTKLKQTIQSFGEKINRESSLSGNLNITIDYLKSINAALVSYTKHMFQVVSNSPKLIPESNVKNISSQQQSISNKSASSQLESNTLVASEQKPILIDSTFEDEDSSLSRNNNNSTFNNEEEEEEEQQQQPDEDLKEINKSMEEMTQQVENNLTTDSDSSSS